MASMISAFKRKLTGATAATTASPAARTSGAAAPSSIKKARDLGSSSNSAAVARSEARMVEFVAGKSSATSAMISWNDFEESDASSTGSDDDPLQTMFEKAIHASIQGTAVSPDRLLADFYGTSGVPFADIPMVDLTEENPTMSPFSYINRLKMIIRIVWLGSCGRTGQFLIQ